MMKLLEDLLARGQEQWKTRTGLGLVLIAVVAFLLGAFAAFDFRQISRIELIVVCVVATVIVAIWWHGRIRPVPKGKAGIGVALECEDSEPARTLRTDLTNRLKSLVSQGSLNQRLEFRQLDVPERLRGDQAALTKLMIRANVHFLLFGDIRARMQGNAKVGVMDLSASVRHAELPDIVQEEFGKEFGKMLPRRVVVPEGQFVLAEAAAEHLEAIARCVIGLAAALSNDFAYAETMLEDAEERVKALLKKGQGKPLSLLLGKVQSHLIGVLQARLIHESYRFSVTRATAELIKAEHTANRLRTRDATHYNATLTIAIAEFLLRGNKQSAMDELNKCKGNPDATWKFSRAFLEAYDGDLSSAYKTYRDALESPLNDDTVIAQVEQFIQAVVEQEPARYWLYFCLGLINYKAKGDLVAAEADLKAFLLRADPTSYGAQIEAANKWLKEIQAKKVS